MRIVVPKKITDEVILSTNLTQDTTTYSGLAEYNSATTYSIGDYCFIDWTIYKSITDSNTGHNPPDYLSGTETTYWEEIGPLNQYAMFDSLTSTQSIASNAATASNASEITEVLDASECDAVFFGNFTATEVEITIKDSSGNVKYTTVESLVSRGTITNFWEFLFNSFTTKTVSLLSFPYRWSSTLEIVIRNTNVGEKAACGRLTIGGTKDIGLTRYECTLSNKDFSNVSTDDFGNTTITERDKVTYVECDVYSLSKNITLDNLKTILDRVQSTPTVWDFNNVKANGSTTTYQCLTFYGYSTSTEISPNNLNLSIVSFKVYGLL